MLDKFLKVFVAMQVRLDELTDRERGATATEYAMLIAFIVVTLALVMLAFGSDVSTFFSAIGHKITTWTGGL
jgi:pilus assembly protein Flp/PilA